MKRPSGKSGIFGVVEYGQGVSILVFDDENKICLVKEYMYTIEKEDIMLVSGGVGDKETPIAAAKRELLK